MTFYIITMEKELLYNDYHAAMRKIADVRYASAVLQWDQETYLPPSGAHFRGQQLATLSEVAHNLFTEEKLGKLLNELNAQDLSPKAKRNVELSLEDYNKLAKFPSSFVRKMSETISAAFHAWVEARKQNDFKIFEPALSALIDLKKQEAETLGYEAHPYNAMLNEYERGATIAMLDKVFADITAPLLNLLQQVQQKPAAEDKFLHQHFPRQQQWAWGQYLAQQLGFDYNAGRQDISEHPFTTNFSSQDVRITTRIDENDFANMTWSTIHEVGHALYEQGLPAEEYGLPSGEYASLGIHESQSRLWENCIGRGSQFWTFYFPKLKEYFPAQFEDVSDTQFLGAINKVQPSLIRTEADELTYHFHVMIRYELEKLLLEGSLLTKDIPAYWNEQYKKLLGVNVPDDKRGCLQDVHWSHGSFGYFPTYSLGSFYAAQFFEKAKEDLPALESTMAETGSTALLLNWLRSQIHRHGKYYSSDDLCELVTGKKLDSRIFVTYLTSKLNKL